MRKAGTTGTHVALGALTALLLSGTAVVTGAGTAVARQVSPTLQYTCNFPLIGGQTVPVQINADIPGTHTVGVPTQTFPIDPVATVNSGLATGLRLLGVQTVEGTAEGNINVSSPQGDFAVDIPFTVPRATIAASGAFPVRATGSAPSLTFTRPGDGKITAGNIKLHLVPRNASGGLTLLGTLDLPCTLNSGQNTLVESFTVVPQPTATATATVPAGPTTPAPPGPGGSATTTPPTTSAPTSAPPSSAPATASSSASISPAGSTAAPGSPVATTTAPASAATVTADASPVPGGVPLPTHRSDSIMEPVLLATAGGVAAAAALGYGWHRRRHRRDDGEGFMTVTDLEELPKHDQ
jgi:hypothetical protein